MFQVDFSDKEQVDEYLKNIEIEYTYDCYNEKKGDACHRLAEFFEMQLRYQDAVKLFQSTCDGYGNSRSCFKLGVAYAKGKGGLTPDLPQALECFEKSCKSGTPVACTVGASVARGLRKFEKNLELLGHGCELSDGSACTALGSMYIDQKRAVRKPGTNETVTNGDAAAQLVAVDWKKAFRYSLRGCELEHYPGCVNVALMYKHGDGVPQSDELFRQFRDRAKEFWEANNVATDLGLSGGP